jgi:hypothetical protein
LLINSIDVNKMLALVVEATREAFVAKLGGSFSDMEDL